MSELAKSTGIRTNYIGNRDLKSELRCCIISNVRANIPQWRRDLSLAPLWKDVDSIKRGVIDYEEFRRRYIENVLSNKNPEEVYKQYEGWYLLCCEKDDEFCHRRILSEWLRDAGFDVKEGLF